MGVYKRKEMWYIDYYVDGRRIRESMKAPNKRLAEQILSKRKVAVIEGKHLDIKKRPKILFREMAELYYETYSLPHKKSYRRDARLIKHLNSFFGNTQLSAITSLMIERYKNLRLKKVAPATVNRELACLKHIYTKAMDWNKTRSNPTKKIKLYREPKGRVRFLDEKELPALLEACGEPLKSMVAIALNTGLRKGNLILLQWKDIDFQRNLIFIEDTKAGEPFRIPINNIVVSTLERQPKYGPYVFSKKNGKPYGDPRKSFKQALEKAGIKDFRWHDLRHCFASYLVMSGVDIINVKELMGHKTIEMTLRYAHLAPEYKKSAVEILGKKMAAMQKVVTIRSQYPSLGVEEEVPITDEMAV